MFKKLGEWTLQNPTKTLSLAAIVAGGVLGSKNGIFGVLLGMGAASAISLLLLAVETRDVSLGPHQ